MIADKFIDRVSRPGPYAADVEKFLLSIRSELVDLIEAAEGVLHVLHSSFREEIDFNNLADALTALREKMEELEKAKG